LKPVMAHIERYPYWHNNLDQFEELHEQGVVLQVNAASLAGAYGPEIQKAAEQFIDKGWVRILGQTPMASDTLMPCTPRGSDPLSTGLPRWH